MQLINQLRSYWNNSPTARNILKVSFGDATSKVLSVAITFLLIRGLTVDDYANYITFSGVAYMFAGVVGVGINMALTRYSAAHLSAGRGKPLGLYSFAIFIQIVIYLIVAWLCLFFPKSSAELLFGQAALATPLRLGLLAGLGLLIVQYARTLYQAEERFNQYIASIWVIQVVIFSSLVILWLVGLLSFQSAAILFAAVQLMVGFWLLIFSFRRENLLSVIKEFLLERRDVLKSFTIGSAWLIGYFLALNMFSRMDILMLLRFSGKKEVALYGVAFQYYSLALLFLGSIHAVLLPKFSKVEMQNSTTQKSFLKQWLQWNFWLILPILIFDILGKPLFIMLNGKTYEQSFPIFIVFSLGIWLSMMFSPLVNILIGEGKFQFLFFLSSVALILNIFLNLLVVPQFGGMGAAVVVVTTYAFINIGTFVIILIPRYSQ